RPARHDTGSPGHAARSRLQAPVARGPGLRWRGATAGESHAAVRHDRTADRARARERLRIGQLRSDLRPAWTDTGLDEGHGRPNTVAAARSACGVQLCAR